MGLAVKGPGVKSLGVWASDSEDSGRCDGGTHLAVGENGPFAFVCWEDDVRFPGVDTPPWSDTR